jgi:uncharacterized protein (TIGR02996 family)
VDPLLARVVERPTDHGPRLVFADARVEAGDPRGEYVQLACALEGMPERDPRRAELERRVAALEHRNNVAWSREVRAIGPFNAADRSRGSVPFAFGAGFVEVLAGSAAHVAPHIDAAAAVAPICRLRLDEVGEPDVEALVACRALGNVRELRLSGRASVEGLFARGDLASVREIVLRCALPVAATVERKLRLERLDLEGAAIGIAGLRKLVEGGVLDEVRRVRLAHQDVGVEGAKLLARLPRLEELCLEHDKIGKAGAIALAGAARLATLRLRTCGLGEKGVAALVASPALSSLRTLDLAGGNGLNAKTIAGVLAALDLPALVDLGLGHSNLKAAGAAVLAASDRLGRIERLDLSGNALKHEGARLLAAATNMPRLRALDLGNNGIDGVGVRWLADGPFLASVRELDVMNNKCGTEGGKALARWPALPRLEKLSLHYNWMGVLGIRAILERAEALVELGAGENNYGPEPSRVLAKAPPPNLRALTLREADTAALTAIAAGPLRDRLETLSLSVADLDEPCAQALAEMPALGELGVSFTTPHGQAAAILRRRFGPFLRVWGHLGVYLDLPGPDA